MADRQGLPNRERLKAIRESLLTQAPAATTQTVSANVSNHSNLE